MAAAKKKTTESADPLHDIKVEIVPVDSLDVYANNPRVHTQDQVELLARSITEFGWTVPVLIDGNGQIIAGHARVAAARHLEMESVPVIRKTDLTEAQQRAYVIADNQMTSTEWDDGLLKLELGALADAKFDLSLTGFTDSFLDGFLDTGPVEGETDPDEIPEPPEEPITKRGDLWLLGAYYECDDCGKRYEYDEGKALAECPCG
jgi:ParB-like chromosome segregation protein Spo0J